MPNNHSCSGVRQFVGISCVHFLVRRLWRLVFNCHMECPMIIRARVCGSSWAFHMFTVYVTTYRGILILPYACLTERAARPWHSDGNSRLRGFHSFMICAPRATLVCLFLPANNKYSGAAFAGHVVFWNIFGCSLNRCYKSTGQGLRGAGQFSTILQVGADCAQPGKSRNLGHVLK